MEFSNELKQFSKDVERRCKDALTEEATKMSLVVPFFQLLGYDVFDPSEFCPEYTADVGIKKGEKVDYAILSDGVPLLLIECKSCNESLEKHGSQLYRYFGTTNAKFGILTNGVVYKFFTDLDESNKMDLVPFLEINILDLKDVQISELKKFCKENFDKDKIFSTASELKYTTQIKTYLSNEMEEPSDDFVKHILTFVYEGQKNQKVIDRYKPLIKKAFTALVNDIVNQKISLALSKDESPEVEESSPAAEDDNQSKIVTTQDELQSFYIVQAIASAIVQPSEIAYRDTESYFGILYHDNNRKPVCRINLDTKNKQIMIPDANKNFTRYYIDELSDIFKYSNELIEVIKRYV